MKYPIVACACMALLWAGASVAEEAAPSASSLRDSAKSTMSTAISAGKNLMGGLTEGVTEGREAAEGADGATSISTFEQLEGLGTVDLLRVESQEGGVVATLGFKNQSDKPLRLINLTQTGALIAIDKDGYSSALQVGLVNPDYVTIPAKVGVRQRFIFDSEGEEVQAIRLWGRDFNVKK